MIAFVGVHGSDTVEDTNWLAEKLINTRLFEDGAGKRWAGSVAQADRRLLLVSQFTLFASCRKTKPDFSRAAGGEHARGLFDQLVSLCRAKLGATRVETGEFGAMMQVTAVGDGPVTIILDSRNKKDALWGEADDTGTPAAATPGVATPASGGAGTPV